MAFRILKRAGLGSCSVVVIALSAFFVYDLREYQPRGREITALLESAPSDRAAMLLAQLQRTDAADRISLLATRSLLNDLDRSSPRLSTLANARRELLWMQLVKIHLSEDERLLIVRRLAFFGRQTRGYDAGARAVFGRTLGELSDLELAELVVIARWPTRYRNPEYADHVRQRAQLLLAGTVSRN